MYIMQHAIIKSKENTGPRIIKVVLKPVRVCTREGCGKELSRQQKKYCSKICRNQFLSSGENRGALTTYKTEYAGKKLDEYLNYCEKGHEPTLIPTNASYLMLHNAKIPTQKGFAKFLKVSRKSFDTWAIAHTEFALVLDRIHDEQEEFLINNGLSGRYNATMAKLILGVNHGFVERKETHSNHHLLAFVKRFYGEVDKLEEEKYGSRS